MLRNQLIALRSSDAVDVMFANPVTGTVEILFTRQGVLATELSKYSCYELNRQFAAA